jgi:hypothetical protein
MSWEEEEVSVASQQSRPNGEDASRGGEMYEMEGETYPWLVMIRDDDRRRDTVGDTSRSYGELSVSHGALSLCRCCRMTRETRRRGIKSAGDDEMGPAGGISMDAGGWGIATADLIMGAVAGWEGGALASATRAKTKWLASFHLCISFHDTNHC